MAVSPLSHFSQDKANRLKWIEYYKVSDECSSGVVRWCMRPRPLPGVCYLCAESLHKWGRGSVSRWDHDTILST